MLFLTFPRFLAGQTPSLFRQMVDCILMVVEEGRTSIKDIKKALEMIPTEKFLGFVYNRRKVSGRKYYYY